MGGARLGWWDGDVEGASQPVVERQAPSSVSSGKNTSVGCARSKRSMYGLMLRDLHTSRDLFKCGRRRAGGSSASGRRARFEIAHRLDTTVRDRFVPLVVLMDKTG